MCRMAEVLVLTVRRGGGTPPYEVLTYPLRSPAGRRGRRTCVPITAVSMAVSPQHFYRHRFRGSSWGMAAAVRRRGVRGRDMQK